MSSKEQTHGNDKTSSKQRRPKTATENSDIAAQQQPHPAAIIQRTRLDPNSLTASDVQQLQRTLGNRAVGQLLAQTAIQLEEVPDEDDELQMKPLVQQRAVEGGDASADLESTIARAPQEKGDLDRPTQGTLIQREVDTSSSPFLPKYEKDEVPGWKDDGGVPEWAKEEYRQESKRTVICSMTPDRKIGSVYFGGEGRIRTTHGSGPERKKHENLTTIQFNINESLAIPEFKKAYPKLIKSKRFWKYFRQWLVQTLENVTLDNAPAWATLVDSPDTAYDLETGSPPKDLKLFEIFKNINGEVESWHPSRGTAAKFDTDKQTISVLHAAIKHIDGMGLVDPKRRNTEFYEFVKSRLPKFVDYMRHPDEV